MQLLGSLMNETEIVILKEQLTLTVLPVFRAEFSALC